MVAKELAAWVQAIGSVGAILVAVGVAWYQNNRAMLQRRQERAEQDFAHVEACLLLCQRTLAHLRAHINNSQQRERSIRENERRYYVSDGHFDDLELTVRTMVVMPAPPDVRRALFDLQRETVSTASNIRSLRAENFISIDSDSQFAQLRRVSKIEADLLELRKRYLLRVRKLGAMDPDQ